MRYIKSIKIFESNNMDKEILDTIRDILISMKVDHSIRVFIKSEVEEIGKVRISFVIEGEIGLDEVLTISHLDNYLRSEEIESAVIATGKDTNKKDELYWFN